MAAVAAVRPDLIFGRDRSGAHRYVPAGGAGTLLIPDALRGSRLRRPIELSPVDPSLVIWRMSGKMAGRGASMRSRQLRGNERKGRP
jgi:hypothetical protein